MSSRGLTFPGYLMAGRAHGDASQDSEANNLSPENEDDCGGGGGKPILNENKARTCAARLGGFFESWKLP